MPTEPKAIQLWDRVTELIREINGDTGGYWYDLTPVDAVEQGRPIQPPSGVIDGSTSDAAYVAIALESVRAGNDAELGIWRRDIEMTLIGFAAATDDIDDLASRAKAGLRLADDLVRRIEAERDILLGGEYGLIDLQLTATGIAGDEMGLQLGAGVAAVRLSGYWYTGTGI